MNYKDVINQISQEFIEYYEDDLKEHIRDEFRRDIWSIMDTFNTYEKITEWINEGWYNILNEFEQFRSDLHVLLYIYEEYSRETTDECIQYQTLEQFLTEKAFETIEVDVIDTVKDYIEEIIQEIEEEDDEDDED